MRSTLASDDDPSCAPALFVAVRTCLRLPTHGFLSPPLRPNQCSSSLCLNTKPVPLSQLERCALEVKSSFHSQDACDTCASRATPDSHDQIPGQTKSAKKYAANSPSALLSLNPGGASLTRCRECRSRSYTPRPSRLHRDGPAKLLRLVPTKGATARSAARAAAATASTAIAGGPRNIAEWQQ